MPRTQVPLALVERGEEMHQDIQSTKLYIQGIGTIDDFNEGVDSILYPVPVDDIPPGDETL